MNYKFRFQKILDLKEKQEDEKKNQISKLLKEINEKKEEIEKVDKDIKNKEHELKDKRKIGSTIMDIRTSNQYLIFLKGKKLKLEFELSALNTNIEKKRAEYLEIRKDKKSYENLKEKDLEKFKYKINKQEEQLIDQIVSFNKNRST
ncbi:flagellar FliJ protein [Acetoanaerobium pronyense]|uniref:Flagellar FliJ protein n=1 Tax=Acetoanaerobium pronyense TaxID=1482736 RepID=A0ABS4KF53_9FIRM|nr:flagellar export protein FliJ [Acetoanaerobium pronyense]MBP2026398.1 flagellar FliJ protein [Acetoanaerobium pronyense]